MAVLCFRSWASIQVYFDTLDFESHIMKQMSIAVESPPGLEGSMTMGHGESVSGVVWAPSADEAAQGEEQPQEVTDAPKSTQRRGRRLRLGTI